MHSRFKKEKSSPERADSLPATEEHVTEWISSPMLKWDGSNSAFSPRHEASTIELFFDLFFVANLATFTDYHAITDSDNFGSYVAFFIILWISWFQITAFDVRFSSDSVWERACKVVHCLYFVTIMLVGYKADPAFVDPAVPEWTHQTLCFALLINRFWLGLQYLITTIYSTRPGHHPKDVVTPLATQTGLFFIVAAIYGSLAAGFNRGAGTVAGFYTAIFAVEVFEIIGTLAISMIWTKLSFRATHLNERLGLLGIIVIGEGVIGLTKTIINTMGQDGPSFEFYALIFCNILILLFIWQLYYDNLPKYRFGVIKQQIWAILHLPLHLAILGVVEGSRQIIVTYLTVQKEAIILRSASSACLEDHLDGAELASRLNDTVQSLKLGDSCPGSQSLPFIYDQIKILGNATGVCSPANISSSDRPQYLYGLPTTFREYLGRASGGVVQSLDLDYLPEDEESGFQQSISARGVVYKYYWGAILLLLACLTVSALLAEDGRKLARFRSVSAIVRMFIVATAIALLTAGNSSVYFFRNFTESPMILPTVVLMLWVVAMGDRMSKAQLMKRRQRKIMDPSP